MKKLLVTALFAAMVLGTTAMADDIASDELIAAAQEEGTLIVYGSCEEEYLAAACAVV